MTFRLLRSYLASIHHFSLRLPFRHLTMCGVSTNGTPQTLLASNRIYFATIIHFSFYPKGVPLALVVVRTRFEPVIGRMNDSNLRHSFASTIPPPDYVEDEKSSVLGLAHYRTISHSFLKGTTQMCTSLSWSSPLSHRYYPYRSKAWEAI